MIGCTAELSVKQIDRSLETKRVTRPCAGRKQNSIGILSFRCTARAKRNERTGQIER